MRSGGRAAVLTAVLGLLALVAAACGVPDDSGPRLIASEANGRTLEPSTSVATTALMPSSRSVIVYLFEPSGAGGEGRLRAVTREVAATTNDERITALLNVQLTEADRAGGLQTNIPEGTQLHAPTELVNGDVLVIDLTNQISTIRGEVQTAAVAQLVYTATAAPEVSGVRFEVEGEPQDVPDQDGAAKSTALTRADFSRLDPSYQPQETTTTTRGRVIDE